MTSYVNVSVILLYTSGTNNLEFSLDQDTTIEELKELIERNHYRNPPKATQRLICRGAVVADGKKMKDFIFDGDGNSKVVFHLICHPSGNDSGHVGVSSVRRDVTGTSALASENRFLYNEGESMVDDGGGLRSGMNGSSEGFVGRVAQSGSSSNSNRNINTNTNSDANSNNNNNNLYYEFMIPRFFVNIFSWHIFLVGLMLFLLPHLTGVLVIVYVSYFVFRYLVSFVVNSQSFHSLDWRNAPQGLQPFLSVFCPFLYSLFSSFNPEEFRHIQTTTTTTTTTDTATNTGGNTKCPNAENDPTQKPNSKTE